MEAQRYLGLLFVISMGLMWSSQARDFYVGGKNGWVLNPSENYNDWAEKNRFLINDTLVFKYNKGTDSVLVVNREDYDKCNTSNPIKSYNDGYSVFTFDRSGPFYFISGTSGNCQKGQKVVVVVLAMRRPPNTPPLPSPPKPSPTSPPTSSPAPTSPATPPSLSPPFSPPTSSPSSSPPSPSPPTSSPSSSPPPSSSPTSSPSPTAAASPPTSTQTPASSPTAAEGPSSVTPSSGSAPSGAPGSLEIVPPVPSPPPPSSSPSSISLISGVSVGVMAVLFVGTFVGPF